MSTKMSSADPHRRSRVAEQDEDDEEDPVETMIAKTGCLEKHYAIQVSLLRPPVTGCSGDSVCPGATTLAEAEGRNTVIYLLVSLVEVPRPLVILAAVVAYYCSVDGISSLKVQLV